MNLAQKKQTVGKLITITHGATSDLQKKCLFAFKRTAGRNPPFRVMSRLFDEAAQCLLSPTAASGLVGWLRVTAAANSFPGGVERTHTQKPWRPRNAFAWISSTSPNSVSVGWLPP